VRRPLLLVLLVLLLAGALARAAELAWVCDDSFISFRYARNLVDGHGLVYNPGERVEGYTNLLWTLAVAGFLAAGHDPLPVSQGLGIACYAALAAVLVAWSLGRSRRTGGALLPLAAGLVLVSDDFHVWATGGLETMLFALLGTAALVAVRGPGRGPAAHAGAGVLLGALVLTRPDGLLWAGAAALSPWVPPGNPAPRRRLACAAAAAIPVAAVLAVWLPWKLASYGELLPTAFHAKSVLDPYVGQGLVYAGLYLAKSWFLLPALLVAAWGWQRSRGAGEPARAGHAAFFLAAGGLYAAYVVHVGGDFMFARRLVPAAPLVFLGLEELLAGLPRPRWRDGVAAAAVAAAALPLPLYGDERLRIEGVADERRYYPPEAIAARRLQAAAVGRALSGTPVRILFEGGMCAFGYYCPLPYLAEATGLTHYSLARQPLEQRGRPGHEKAPGPEWLRENRIHLVVRHDFPPLPPPEGPLPFDEVRFGSAVRAHVQLYDDRVMDALRDRPGVRFTPIEEVVARRREQIERSDRARAERIYAKLHRYYLRSGTPRARRVAAELRARIEAKPPANGADGTGGPP